MTGHDRPEYPTNAHVVKNASTVVVTVDGFQTKGIVQLRDLKMDIAFIRLDGTVLKPVEFTKGSAVLMPGDVVFALGAPQGLTRSITEGIVSARRTIDGISLVQTSAAISPGSSGGGLFNSAGQLAGITTFKVAKGESLNFAIEIAEVMKLHDASRDAQAIVLGVDLSSRLAFEGAFVRWLYTERGETGRTVLDEYREAEDRMSRGALTLAELSEKSREIVDRYYQRINPSNVKSASLTGNAANSPTTLVLVCQLYGDPDRPSSAKSYVVDFEKRLINSRPAKISSEFMRYSYLNDEGTEFTTVFDRNAATVAISTAEFPNLFQGKCAKSEGRAF